MPDLDAVLSSVRDQLAVVARRRDDLDRQRAHLDSEYARLSTAVSVMEEHVGPAAQPSSTAALADRSSPLSQRILDALAGSSATRRADLLTLFRPLGINENTLDSAIYRLRKRGAIQKRGKYLVPVLQTPPLVLPSVSSDVSAGGSDRHGADPQHAGVEAGLEPGPFSGTVPVLENRTPSTVPGPLPAPADEIPLTVRVQEAVATLEAPTRALLVQHFAAHGVKPAAVDVALAGLRKRGKLERRGAGGVLVVSASDAPSVPVDAVSHGA